MCFLSLIDCLQRDTLSTQPGQEVDWLEEEKTEIRIYKYGEIEIGKYIIMAKQIQQAANWEIEILVAEF